ncbi:hypothetical protein BK025_13545 [Sodalis sp. TME1]|nr:hypothetical protein BK025_13545 [Sodalis sp. TME1]
MLRKVLFVVTAGCTVLGTSGCSSVMTHTGPYQGYYLGTRASMQVLRDKDSNWCIRPLAAIDLPFSAVLDTVLLPYDYFRRDSNTDEESPRSRMLHSHQHERATPPKGD